MTLYIPIRATDTFNSTFYIFASYKNTKNLHFIPAKLIRLFKKNQHWRSPYKTQVSIGHFKNRQNSNVQGLFAFTQYCKLRNEFHSALLYIHFHIVILQENILEMNISLYVPFLNLEYIHRMTIKAILNTRVGYCQLLLPRKTIQVHPRYSWGSIPAPFHEAYKLSIHLSIHITTTKFISNQVVLTKLNRMSSKLTGWWGRKWKVWGDTTATAKKRRNTKLLTAEYCTWGSSAEKNDEM